MVYILKLIKTVTNNCKPFSGLRNNALCIILLNLTLTAALVDGDKH